MRTDFQEIETRRTKTGPCPNCGKRRTRTKRFWQTENPWNRNADGSVKSRAEIWESVNAEADEWVPDFTCCEVSA